MKFDTLDAQSLPLIIQPEKNESNSALFLNSWLKDNLPSVFELLYKHGAILFRGFKIDNENLFHQCVTNLSPQLLDYKGGDSPRTKVSNGIYLSTTYPAEYSIPMHNEKSYSRDYPKFLFFNCQIPAVEGGETPLLDGRKLTALLDENLIERFTKKKLKYVMNLHAGKSIGGKSWQETFETDDKHQVEAVLQQTGASYYWKPNGHLRMEEVLEPIVYHPKTQEKLFFSQADQWHSSHLEELLGKETFAGLKKTLGSDNFYHNCYFGDGSEIPLEDVKQIREILANNQVKFKWQQGDLLIVDNLLTLHGRSPYKGNRRILVSMS